MTPMVLNKGLVADGDGGSTPLQLDENRSRSAQCRRPAADTVQGVASSTSMCANAKNSAVHVQTLSEEDYLRQPEKDQLDTVRLATDADAARTESELMYSTGVEVHAALSAVNATRSGNLTAIIINDGTTVRQRRCLAHGYVPIVWSHTETATNSGRDKIVRMLRERLPDLVWITMFGMGDDSRDNKKRAWRIHAITNVQLTLGGVLILEADANSRAWEWDAITSLQQDNRLQTTMVKSCCFDIKHPVSNLPVGHTVKFALSAQVESKDKCNHSVHHRKRNEPIPLPKDMDEMYEVLCDYVLTGVTNCRRELVPDSKSRLLLGN